MRFNCFTAMNKTMYAYTQTDRQTDTLKIIYTLPILGYISVAHFQTEALKLSVAPPDRQQLGY